MARTFVSVFCLALAACRSSAPDRVAPPSLAAPSEAASSAHITLAADVALPVALPEPPAQPSASTPRASTMAAHAHAATTSQRSRRFVCPMHAAIVRTDPGACPECGMQLEARE